MWSFCEWCSNYQWSVINAYHRHMSITQPPLCENQRSLWAIRECILVNPCKYSPAIGRASLCFLLWLQSDIEEIILYLSWSSTLIARVWVRSTSSSLSWKQKGPHETPYSLAVTRPTLAQPGLTLEDGQLKMKKISSFSLFFLYLIPIIVYIGMAYWACVFDVFFQTRHPPLVLGWVTARE